VEKAFDDHVAKQRAGMLSTTMRADRDSGLGKILNARLQTRPGSPEWKALEKQITDIDDRMTKRVPGERHRQRMIAHYVDPISPTEWNRPSEKVTQEFARDFLTDAVNDYSIQSQQHYAMPELIKDGDPDLYSALTGWADRPAMPKPEHPAYSVNQQTKIAELVKTASVLTVVIVVSTVIWLVS
jgi:hypothetical protein